MIVTEKKPFGLIKSMLEKYKDKKISVITCNACAKVCETGGEKQLNEMVEKLTKEGYKVVHKEVIPTMCRVDLVKKTKIDADVIVVLSCDAGVFAVKKVYKDKKIIEALDTIGLGARDENNNIYLVKRFE